MKATQKLHDLGQSLWLDNITRDLLDSGTLKRYIDELSVTGLTSNPTIFDHAIKKQHRLRRRRSAEGSAQGKSGEALFFELALEDLTRAADLFRPVHDRTDGVDGWVSLEVSPLLAYDTKSTLAAAQGAASRGPARPNLFIKIPGTQGGPARHRGGDLRRRADQRDAALLARAVPRGGRGLPARHRAAHRRRARTRTSARSPRSSSAAGTSRSRARCPTALDEPARHRDRASARTRRTASCSPRRAGSAPTTRARGRSGCSGRAPAPRTRRPPTSSTSRRWRRRSRSTPCPRAR